MAKVKQTAYLAKINEIFVRVVYAFLSLIHIHTIKMQVAF